MVSYTLTRMNVACAFHACKRRRPVQLEVSQSGHRQPQWLLSHLEMQRGKKKKKSYLWSSKLKEYEAILNTVLICGIPLEEPSLSAGVSQSGGSHPVSHLHSFLWSQTCSIYTYINSSNKSYSFWCTVCITYERILY